MLGYRVHNLALQSDFAIETIARGTELLEDDGVIIAAGAIPGQLEQPEKVRRHYQTAPGVVLLHAKGVGRMLVEHGRRITYEGAPGCTDELLAGHVLGSGLAAIHHQRGNVVLHGASICRGGRVFLICGKSGAGKSTTTAHLLANGGETLGDDVAAIGDGPNYLVHPGPASTRLADDALARLPQFAALAGNERCVAGKRIVPTIARFAAAPLPLGGIIVLQPGEGDGVTAEPLEWNLAFTALQMHTFRKRFITSDMVPILKSKWGALAHRLPIWGISRPAGRDTLREVVTKAEFAIAAMAHKEQGPNDDCPR